jgi:hypothetical protein
MSRLVLKPTLELRGVDPSTEYNVEYSGDTGILTIGCQEYTLREWKRRGVEIIAKQKAGPASVPGCECTSCCQLRKTEVRRRAAAVRKYLPRLNKLIQHIEKAEAALKKSLRAQTKAS